ncbi:nuclear receptor-binding factor 2-like [Leptopilina heterotoma]|uniref:nuclear receptor-binding factor 2-like n=1 Tax=Leptopilina heterotoma TaxID=63436 RepID=UPI001CA9204E|nr:nuclear receptor-binding factor 2-like [Leptopilina heterotoma]
METSALNAAHESERRAEAFLREGKFEEAAKCHERVANLLTEAHSKLETRQIESNSCNSENQSSMKPSIQSLATLESLALQRDYHTRQASIVRMKQARYEEYKATLEAQRRDLYNKQEINKRSDENVNGILDDKCECSLKQAIYRTIEEQDSLLNVLELPSQSEKNQESQTFKHPKDTGTVIEELRTVNIQLRSLIGSLLSQLEEKEDQVRQLTERLHEISVDTSEEIHHDETHSLRLAPLPPLTPLEMPRFDFNST